MCTASQWSVCGDTARRPVRLPGRLVWEKADEAQAEREEAGYAVPDRDVECFFISQGVTMVVHFFP